MNILPDEKSESGVVLKDWLSSLAVDHLDLVFVEWVDAFGCPAGWDFESDVEPSITTVRSVGFVVKETDEFVFVAPHISTTKGQRQLAGHIAVPKRQITKLGRITSCSDVA